MTTVNILLADSGTLLDSRSVEALPRQHEELCLGDANYRVVRVRHKFYIVPATVDVLVVPA